MGISLGGRHSGAPRSGEPGIQFYKPVLRDPGLRRDDPWQAQLSGTSKPRFVPGRAIIASYQRLTFG